MNGSGDANKKKLQVLKMPWRHLRIKNLHKSDPLSLPKEKRSLNIFKTSLMPMAFLYALFHPKACTTKWYLYFYSSHLARYITLL